MESRVFSKCTRNIHRPSKPEKEVNRKENTVGKISHSLRKSTHTHIPTLGKLIFCDKENRDLSSKIYHISFGGTSEDLLDR